MYEWLPEALQCPATVITANRRLARVLRQEFAEQQLRDGKTAWQSPAIHAWQDWLTHLLQTSAEQESLPTRLNQQQSQLLWERCLQKEMPDSVSGVASLVKLSRDAWQRLGDWQVSIGDVARSAQNDDQRLFARVAGRYLAILEHERWVDDAGLGQTACDLIESGQIAVSGRITFAGFDRERPIVTSIRELLANAGCEVQDAPVSTAAKQVELQRFENSESEFRAAGAWVRERLVQESSRKIAIISSNLEQQAEHKTRLVREGLVPGWQYAENSVRQAVNVSYGRKLIDYPAVSIALLLLQWLVRDLTSIEVAQLLRSPLVAGAEIGGRSHLELRLRRLPDRGWSPSMISDALRGRGAEAEVGGWTGTVASLSKLRRELRNRNSPAGWAVFIDATLKACQWPGQETLSSYDFQLVNRWRDLLNDMARLDLVSPSMTLKTALRRLELMAADTVFQPESESASVQLLGPLEASGARFDAIWVSGLTAANWPPAGNASPLLSRKLQREKGMPDAEPADTLEYAQNMLLRLSASAEEIVCSYPLTEDDAEQTPSDLLSRFESHVGETCPDPGWHAASLLKSGSTEIACDVVPPVAPDEQIAGGAGTIQRQLSDPLAAFIVGRLGVKSLQPQAIGIPPSLRGNIIHDVLYSLYLDKPTREEIASWGDDDLDDRLGKALDFSFSRNERNTDAVLFELLRLERIRIKDMMRNFVRTDSAREAFEIASVEHQVNFEQAGVRMQLRVDRIDRFADGSLAILDYKTGAKKKFLQADGQPREMQLVAYASAMPDAISALALVNIDSREMSFDGAGCGYTDDDDWLDTLEGWQQQVRFACDNLTRGDVRINAAQGVMDARPFNLLSRYTELRRDV